MTAECLTPALVAALHDQGLVRPHLHSKRVVFKAAPCQTSSADAAEQLRTRSSHLIVPAPCAAGLQVLPGTDGETATQVRMVLTFPILHRKCCVRRGLCSAAVIGLLRHVSNEPAVVHSAEAACDERQTCTQSPGWCDVAQSWRCVCHRMLPACTTDTDSIYKVVLAAGLGRAGGPVQGVLQAGGALRQVARRHQDRRRRVPLHHCHPRKRARPRALRPDLPGKLF